MANFGIMRIATGKDKIKSGTALGLRLAHNLREKTPKNADPALIDQNKIFGKNKTVKAVMRDFHEKLPEKRRSNAVLAVEQIFTLSKGSKCDPVAYFKGVLGYWVDFWGAENCLSFVIHEDEETIHAHGISMPLFEGKLNAKHFIGGDRRRMQKLQDDFYEKVSKPLGLDRGERRNYDAEEQNKKHVRFEDWKNGEIKRLEDREIDLDRRESELDLREEQIKNERELIDGEWAEVDEAKLELDRLVNAAPDLIKATFAKISTVAGLEEYLDVRKADVQAIKNNRKKPRGRA